MPPRESRGSSKSRASLLFGEEEEEEEEDLRCAHALCIERENEQQNVLTSKLFALNPFDAGVANAINDFDDDIFSPETCVVVVSPKLSSSLVFKAATTTTPGKATTHKATTKAQKNTTTFAHLLRV